MILLKMACRNVLRQRRRTTLTVLSMAVGYALLSISLSVGDGSYNLIIDQFTGNITGHVQVHNKGYLERPSLNSMIRSPQEIKTSILKQMPDAELTERIKGGALAYGQKRVVPVGILAVDPPMEDRVTGLKSKVKKGQYFSLAGSGGQALLGKKIANNLKLDVGDELVLISSGADGSIANAIFTVRGIVGSGDSYIGQMVVLTLPGAREFFAINDAIHEMIIKLDSYQQARDVAANLSVKTSRAKTLDIDPWQEVEKEFYQSMEADKKGNNVSILIIVIMVGIGVLNTVLMSVLERMREYGLLRAIGVRPTNILSLVLLEIIVLSFLGVLVGAGLALPVNYWFQEYGIVMEHSIEVGGMVFERIIGEISYNSMVFPGFVIIVTAVVVSLFPAVKAASVAPIEVLDGA